MIRKAEIKDLEMVCELASKLYHADKLELMDEFKEIIKSTNNAFFLKFDKLFCIGFAHVSLRQDYVEGTNSSPVGYLEGIFIQPKYRNLGYAKSLIKECENWAIDLGCTEFASDCELENEQSIRFHLKSGFKIANKIVCFTKKL